ncbi:MAG TPA: protein kinase [Longimicrobiales bacterium]|nr:protein kinase [Longimicrobiales bacterium]
MRLDPGTRLGPYEVVGPVGAGGMAQVYRARDTRLGRDVAIKVIAVDQAPTDEQRRRFDREARAVAQLAHPHICSIFDVGHDRGIDYIVIELLEGETLASRLERGPLPIEQCLSLGARMASALAAAHSRGIVHRDFKPANVMLTATGPKLLDFGIAKAFGSGSTITDDAAAATSAKLTATGTVVGTVPYMAPEQIEGAQPDARTDVFALGAVLYEMATGRPAFSAPNPVALVAAVLASDPPPISSVRRGAPPSLDRLVQRCLAKDPAERWQSAHDIALQLNGIADESHARVPRPGRAAMKWWSLALAGAIAIAGIAIAWTSWLRPDGGPSVRFTIDAPAGGGFAWSSETNPLAMSPDGQQLAFIAFDSTGDQRIWLRPLSSLVATPLQGTSDAQSLMWSPDGKAIAFFTSDRLQRVDLPDGTPVTVMRIASRTGHSGTWGRGGYILFTGVQGEAIYRVASSGGTPEVVLRPDTTTGETRVLFPWYLPDGERFLYTSTRGDNSSLVMVTGVGQRPRAVTVAESLVQYAAPGVLASVRDGTLMGQAFDARSAKVSGEPFTVAEGVRYFLSTNVAALAVSQSAGGTLAFQTGRDLQRFVWLDRSGSELGAAGSTASYLAARISPDGRRVLVTRQVPELGTFDIWMTDLDRGTETPLTSARGTEAFALWLPGGQTVAYSVATGGPPNIVRRDLAGAAATSMFPGSSFQIATDVSPDGMTLLYRARPATGTFDLWTLPLQGGTAPAPLLETPFTESDARFSPDGRYIAVISDETGRPELYVTAFPGPGEKLRISTSGALMMRWPRQSGEIVYVTPEGWMMAVSAQTQPTLRVGTPVTLFTAGPDAHWTAFDVTPDGQRFLVAVPIARANRQPITVITNWTATISR